MHLLSPRLMLDCNCPKKTRRVGVSPPTDDLARKPTRPSFPGETLAMWLRIKEPYHNS
jgi:hypothetical protein